MGRVLADARKERKNWEPVGYRCALKRSLQIRAEKEQERHIRSGFKRLQVDCDTMAEVKARLYGQCSRKRKLLGWQKCPKFILDPLIDRMIAYGNIKPEDTFLDIGSGIGNVVESVATRVGCACTGVELAKPNHDVAVAAKPLFEKYREEHKLLPVSPTYIHADVTKMDADIILDSSVIWCANKLFPMEANCYLIDMFKQCKPGTRIFVMTDLYLHNRPECPSQAEHFKYFDFKDWTWGAGDVEWTDEPGAMFMYTRTDYVDEDESGDESE